MDYDEMESDYSDPMLATEKYYKEGVLVGIVNYVIDENGRYWPSSEEWMDDNGDWLITDYYRKDDYREFTWTEGFSRYGGIKTITANGYGTVSRRYGRHVLENGFSYVWYDDAQYYPSAWNEVPFNPTGHIMQVYSSPNFTVYNIGGRSSGENGEHTNWGYDIYHGNNNGYDPEPFDWESVTVE